MSEYLAMGGYAVYVWPAYGLAALVLGGMAVVSVLGLKRRRAELASLDAVRPRRTRLRGTPAAATAKEGA